MHLQACLTFTLHCCNVNSTKCAELKNGMSPIMSNTKTMKIFLDLHIIPIPQNGSISSRVGTSLKGL